jgi:hypothetical protein
MRGIERTRGMVLALGILGLLLMPVASANLLSNPGMEEDTNADGIADGWVGAQYIEPNTGSSSWLSIQTDPNQVFQGSASQEMGVTGKGYAAVHQTVEAFPGVAYTLKAHIRYAGFWTPADHPSGPPGDRAWMKLEFYDAGGNMLNNGTQTYNFYYWYTWQQRTMSRIAPAGTVAVRAVLGMQHWGNPAPNATTHWFQYDNAQLTPEPSAFVLLALGLCLRRGR